MSRSLYTLVLLGLLAGCVPINTDPSRDQFGVSAARPDAGQAPPADPQLAALATKVNAVCTTGDQAAAPTLLPAQDNQQLVDQKLRCGHYDRLKVDFVHMDWTNIL
jgi:hypothetical protein